MQVIWRTIQTLIALALLVSACGDDGGPNGAKADAQPIGYCDALTPCMESGKRYCDIAGEYPASEGRPNTCIADPLQTRCSAGAPCTAAETPHCTNAGECVACLNFSHCSAATPVCSLTTHTCGSCRVGDEGNQICSAIDPLQPFCADTGACVECLDNSVCNVVSAAICDLVEFRCRGCIDSSECGALTCNLVTGVCESI